MHLGVIQEFAVEAVSINWQFPIIEPRVLGGHLGPKILSYMVSESPKNTLKLDSQNYHIYYHITL